MIQPRRIAFIGNSLPRRCGIATFTTDLQQAVSTAQPELVTAIVAMNDHGQRYDYPPTVRFQIDDDHLEDYRAAAAFLNAGHYDVVSLQHEFGIFGGAAGGHILTLLGDLEMPVVTTLHTVLAEPSAEQRRVLSAIIDASARIIVMAEKGRDLLRTVYAVPEAKITVIAHGIPDFDFVEPDAAKAKLGYAGRSVILTFGLLSPNKGIEVIIDAMPAILRSCPNAIYVVLGATHPNLVRDHGEAYRHSVQARAMALGVADHVVFLDRFVDRATLLTFIAMCDVYATPYLNVAQMTSGTLAYSFGLGKAVVSTPYWHACELLADGRGVLVPFGDSVATGREIAALLTDEPKRLAMRRRAYLISRSMTWERAAERYGTVFQDVVRERRVRPFARIDVGTLSRTLATLPDMEIGHLLAMCDDTGLFQHALLDMPDRSHGYCTDDNARALLVACALNRPGETRLPESVTSRLAAFIQHAWNPDTKRFRNFMSFDRRWLEEQGSEDSHGRALWALGECTQSDANHLRRRWASDLFVRALPIVETFTSPRALAFTLLGLDRYCPAPGTDASARRLRLVLGGRLMRLIETVETDDWVWFEQELAYDNARLPQALLVTGVATGRSDWIAAALRSLRWLMSIQRAPSGHFRPVGSSSFGRRRELPQPFDQQPLEATAAISACLMAASVDGETEWWAAARRVFDWFHGRNDLSVSLVDLETGACRDGLHPDRANENRGAESVVSYLLSLAEIRHLARLREDRRNPAPSRFLQH